MDEEARDDYEANRDYYQEQRKTNRAARGKRYPCPTCGRKGALSAWEHSQNYQCSRCADTEERGW